MTDTSTGTPIPLEPSGLPRAAGYVRVSRRLQQEGYSPAVQRAGIAACAQANAHALVMVEEDAERGSKVTRAGYQRILAAVRARCIETVIVYRHDRWGRDGIEWLTRARELDRLGVPIISVQEGRDEGGMMRYVRAGMAEEESRRLAARITPARRQAARSGTHMGRTPYGYRRLYPAREGGQRVAAGVLVIDEAEARVVREIYARYASGQYGTRALLRWLTSDLSVPRPRSGAAWSSYSLRYLLRNPVYHGAIRFDVQAKGLYERRPEGSAFVVQGTHEAIVDEETWQRAQQQSERARRNGTTVRPDGAALPLGYGVLRCADCGGPMILRRPRRERRLHGRSADGYDCLNRAHGRTSTCTSKRYRAPLAHDALLRELLRLEGCPWEDLRVGGTSEAARTQHTQRATLQRALGHERAMLKRHAQHLLLFESVGEIERAAFREVGAEIAARITALETQLTALQPPGIDRRQLRRLHRRMLALDIPALVGVARASNHTEVVRDLLLDMMQSAVIVERVPAQRATWLRAEVRWSADVQTLLNAGLLRLGPPSPPPPPPAPVSAAEAAQASHERYLRRVERHGAYWRTPRADKGNGEKGP